MLKRIGLSAAALFAALVVVVQPPTAAAQNRDFNGRNSYNNHQPNSYGQTNAQWNAYGSNDRSQNSYAYNRQPNGYVSDREQNARVSQQFYGRTESNQRLSGNGWSAQGWREHDRNSQQYQRFEDSDDRYNSGRR
jgi:hypothetical protein